MHRVALAPTDSLSNGFSLRINQSNINYNIPEVLVHN